MYGITDYEVMAPVGSRESLMAALQAGADSIYFGVCNLNMRAGSASAFTTGDLRDIAAICREHGVKSYLTVNTIVYDEDMALMHDIVDAAREAGIDAVIASDVAVMNAVANAPSAPSPLSVHLSTQLNISNVEALRFYARYADVVVLARELRLEQVAEIHRRIVEENICGPSGRQVRIEMFCHGALCMAISGKCYMSLHAEGRSANRGECIQICRRSYTVTDNETGHQLEIDNKYIMSPKDLKTVRFIDRMMEAGVRVFKIEGRARGPEYVYTVVKCYKEAIAAVVEGTFTEEKKDGWDSRLATVFNRGFWDGYYQGQLMGEWNKQYGSCATERKVYIGRGVKYFSKIGVAEFTVEATTFSVGDRLLVTGPTTGVMYLTATEIHDNDGHPVDTAPQGQRVAIPVTAKVRPSDKLFKLVATLMLMLLVCTGTIGAKVPFPGDKYFIYRYTLRDKAATSHSLDHPQRFLSRRSVERRYRQGLPLDSTDLPVCWRYVRQFEVEGAQVVGTSRWHNTVVVRSSDSLLLERLALLPIVRDRRCVFIAPDSVSTKADARPKTHHEFNKWDSVRNDPLGMARPQIEMLHGDSLHDAGFRGQGMVIAILDGGFQNYDRIPALRKARIAGVRDFVPSPMGAGHTADRMHQIDHGTRVLSVLAAQAPEVVMGTATEATYWLLRCEDPLTEQPVEEDFWTMAAEMADSAGADIINSSLGYYKYDNDLCVYRLQDLDGQTAYISQSASLLASKGIVLCNSAGNSGMGQWKKIGVPADARDILTVGAVTKERHIATFCSIGPSQDGRVKPDVVAQGAPTALISGRGTLLHDMGTSFSTPLVSGLVACLWQAHREKTATEIIDMVRRCSDQYTEPTNIYGYGIPDFRKAHKTL